MTGRTESAVRLVDDDRAERSRDIGAAVVRSVVDHDRPIAVGHPREHPRQRCRLVQARQDHVDRRIGHVPDAKASR